MLHYIKTSILTLIEAFILFATASYVLAARFNYIGTQFFYKFLFFAILFLVVFIKSMAARFRRFWVLHRSIHKVDRMTGEEFELFLKAHFENLGCTANTTKTSNDYGADLILWYKGRTIAVQAKRYHSTIGVKAVQEVIGSMAYYGTDVGLVVTNSYYSKNAVELASANNIILWDREVLVRMMNGENMSRYLSEFF